MEGRSSCRTGGDEKKESKKKETRRCCWRQEEDSLRIDEATSVTEIR